MRLTFSLDFDAGAWPGPTPLGGASVGEAWLGPAGFLRALETQLGLEGPSITAAERIASILAGVAAETGFHSRSAGSDLVGTARRLLRDRDLLWVHGWRGQGLTPRLSELAAATKDALPGVPDRLEAVGSALRRGDAVRTPFGRLRLVERVGAMPPLWRELFEELGRLGTVYEEMALPPAAAGGDLRAARDDEFEPRGDGSLELVRGYGPLQTADDVAAWLAAHAPIEETLVIGADEILDAALRRHGLPTTGASSATSRPAWLQIVPLALDFLFDPPDPRRALEFVCLPDSPVPPALRWRLRRALREWPAVGSPAWREAVQDHLAEVGEERRAELERRFCVLLTPSVRYGELVPLEAIRVRVEEVARWVRRRVAVAGAPSSMELASGQCRILRRLLDAWPEASLPESQLRRLVEAATESVPAPPSLPAQAGLEAVGAPGCMAGAAEVVVWWSFSRDEASLPAGIRLPPAEVAALRRAEVAVPDRGAEATSLAVRWRRPLLQTRRKLMLCCPRRAMDGEELFPHPLWDEIEARIPRNDLWRLRSRLIVERPGRDRPIPTEARSRISLPVPRRRWTVSAAPGSLHRTEESASGMIGLVRCPFAWTCRYPVALDDSAATYWIRTDDRVRGSLAHLLLRKVIESKPASADAAEALVEGLFAELGPLLAADLFLPGAATEQADTSLLLARGARALVTWLGSACVVVEGVEVTHQATIGSYAVKGRLDLVLGPEPAVVDLKLGSRRRYTEELQSGTACQLAVYGRLLQEAGGSFPRVGYFILATGQLISPQPTAVKGSQEIPGGNPADTWLALEAAYARGRATIDDGEIHATGIPGLAGETAPERDSLAEGELALAPGCDYCRYGGVCGRSIDVMP